MSLANIYAYRSAIIFTVSLFCITGCSSTGTMQVQKSPTTTLKAYRVVGIDVSSTNPESDRKFTEQIAASILIRLRKAAIFDKVYSMSATVEKNFDLMVAVKITDISKVNSTPVVLAGVAGLPFAGKDAIEVNLRLVDGKTNETLAQATVKGARSAGSSFFCADDPLAAERVAGQIADFVIKNR